MSTTLHVTPRNDLIEHEDSEDCPCGPRTGLAPRADGSDGWLVIHNSLDGREQREQEQLPPGLPWAPAFAWLFGRRCPARLHRRDAPGDRWGRCELRFGHVASDTDEHVDHALEHGLQVLRWPAWSGPGRHPYTEETR